MDTETEIDFEVSIQGEIECLHPDRPHSTRFPTGTTRRHPPLECKSTASSDPTPNRRSSLVRRPFPTSRIFSATTHFLNASYAGIEGVTLGAYAYLMEFRDKSNWDNNTFGASAKGDALGLTLYGELAW